MDISIFLVGWRRRSALILDAAGCPQWLVKIRCPHNPEWGTVLNELVRRIDPGWPDDE